jgi:hypothetical protein
MHLCKNCAFFLYCNLFNLLTIFFKEIETLKSILTFLTLYFIL